MPAKTIDLSTEPESGTVTLYTDELLTKAAKTVLDERKKLKLKGARTLSQLFKFACIDLVKRDGRKYGAKLPAHLQK